MSELLNKTIKRVDLKPEPWHRNNGWYGHIVYFTDGTKGEIFECNEANPEYLQEGKSFIHETRPNRFPDKPYLVTPKKIEEIKKHEHKENESSSEQNTSYNRFQKRSNSNSSGGWKGYAGNYENSPDIWLKKQKFISMLKLYEVLTPLVIKGELEYKNIKKEVDEHLEHILEKSGMNNLPPAPVAQAHSPSHTSIKKPAVKHVAPSSSTTPAKKNEDNIMHTSREALEEPVINPDAYSSESPSTLFDQDSNMKNEPAPADILEKISKCSKKAQLTALQRSLTVDQLKNKNIMNAFFSQKNKLSNKK